MKSISFICLLIIGCNLTFAQNRKMIVIGSSTAAGLNASPIDSSWVNRLNYYYKYQLGKLDSTYNLAVSGSTVYSGMPTSYIPVSRPAPDPVHNVTQAVTNLSDLATPANGVIIVNYPTNGYDNYSIPEIMSSLQLIYDSAIRTGNRCFITTAQPRTDGNFGLSAIKRKLADIKDSIISRFGVPHTINFWDGMYNTADTTIATAYYSGDLTHFNNAGHRELFNRVVAKNIFTLTYTAQTGDYQSNVSPTGLWSDAASWQTYNGSAWVAAVTPPTSSNGVITIVNGDSIRINTATNFDQVVIESGAALTMFNFSIATAFTLNDAPGADITVNGRLYISVNGTLSGTGTIQNNSGGLITIRNMGILSVNTDSEGALIVNNTGNIQNANVTNYGTLTLVNFTLNLNSTTFSNYGTIDMAYNDNSYIAGTGGVLINNTNAFIFKSNALGIAQINSGITFTNKGTIKGTGQYVFYNAINNTGNISPGNSPGSLTVNPAFITGKSPVLKMEINSTGSVAGTNYDQLNFSVVDFLNTNVTGATLQVTDLTGDPVGTTYTLLRSPSGSITGPFAQVTLSASLGNLVYNSNSITVQKTSPLSVTWGRFNATVNNQQVVLNWQTQQETNAAHFVIEHSTNGQQFSPIGTVAAKGNSTIPSNYVFTHSSPNLYTSNYYRLRQVDLDDKDIFSAIRSVRFSNGTNVKVQATPNPVHNMLQVNVQARDISIEISHVNGTRLYRSQLQPGTHLVNLEKYPAGFYQLIIYQKRQRIMTQKVIKL